MCIRYSGCIYVALGTQHEMRMRHIVICGLSDSKIFFPHYLLNGTIFENKFLIIKPCFDFLYNFV